MAEKIYYWIKLRMDFLKSPIVKLLRRMSGGDTYALIYLEMILLSLENNGFIYFTGIGKDMADEIALVLDEKKIDVEFLLSFLTNKRLIEFSDPNAFKFSEDVTDGLIGKETSGAKRVRAWRKRQKALQSNGDVTDRNTEIDIDIDKDTDKECSSSKSGPNSENAFEKYAGIGLNLSATQQAIFNGYFEDLGNDILCHAISYMDDHATHKNFSYLQQILRSYDQADVKSLEDVKKLEERRKTKNKQKKKQYNDFAGAHDDSLYKDVPF